MSGSAEWHDVALPPGAEAVIGVYVNGVERREGTDYEVRPDRVHLFAPLQGQPRTSGLGKVLLSIGIGVYPKGDVVDLSITRQGRTAIVRGKPVSL